MGAARGFMISGIRPGCLPVAVALRATRALRIAKRLQFIERNGAGVGPTARRIFILDLLVFLFLSHSVFALHFRYALGDILAEQYVSGKFQLLVHVCLGRSILTKLAPASQWCCSKAGGSSAIGPPSRR